QARDVDGAYETPAQLDIHQDASMPVEGDEISRQARALPVARGEAGVVPEGLGIRGEQVRRDREAAGQELVADLLGRHAESKDDACAPGTALAPVMRIALELQPSAGLEADEPEGPRADGSLAPARADRAGSLRNDCRRSVREQGGEEGNGLLQFDEELRS